jgi:hypothetical protein
MTGFRSLSWYRVCRQRACAGILGLGILGFQ